MLEGVWSWLVPRLEVIQRVLFRPVIRQLEQRRRETLELEKLLLAIARVEGTGRVDEPGRPPDRDP
jgi:hypothetical protein